MTAISTRFRNASPNAREPEMAEARLSSLGTRLTPGPAGQQRNQGLRLGITTADGRRLEIELDHADLDWIASYRAECDSQYGRP